jgi:hypothetical protein
MYFEPIGIVFLPSHFFLISDLKMIFNWQTGVSTIPVNLGLGYAFSKNFTSNIRPEYDVSGIAGNWDVTWSFDFLNW